MGQDQLTAAAPLSSGEMVIGSSNPGKIQYLSNKHEAKGVYTSVAKDLDNVSQISLEVSSPTSAITYEIRTGNASAPDTTWSTWEPITAGKPPAKSPQARYAQLRATLSGAEASNPSLSWLQLAYVQRNIRPLIREMTLYPAGEAFQRSGGSSVSADPDVAGLETGSPEIKPPTTTSGRSTDAASLGRKLYFRSLRTLTWRAEDANGDDLRYDVLYRPESSSSFTQLRADMQDPVFTWDTATVPSGRYVLRVVARDQKSNTEGRGLGTTRRTRKDSMSTTIPPTIAVTMSGGVARVVVSDAVNTIRKAEWAKEAGTWTDLTPLDGLADSREESFEIHLDSPVPAAIVIRATDAFGNVALKPGPASQVASARSPRVEARRTAWKRKHTWRRRRPCDSFPGSARSASKRREP